MFRLVEYLLVRDLSWLDSKEIDKSSSWFSFVVLPISRLPSIADSATIMTLSSVVLIAKSHSWSMSGDSSLRGAAVSSVHTLLGSPWVISTSMYSVLFLAALALSIMKVTVLLLPLTSPSGVRVVPSVVMSADIVVVFRFLVCGYRMLFGTAIAVCVDC